jgi:hypothetical protein
VFTVKLKGGGGSIEVRSENAIAVTQKLALSFNDFFDSTQARFMASLVSKVACLWPEWVCCTVCWEHHCIMAPLVTLNTAVAGDASPTRCALCCMHVFMAYHLQKLACVM